MLYTFFLLFISGYWKFIDFDIEQDTAGTDNATSSSSGPKSANDVEGASSSSSAIDSSGNASTVPLGLGLGGLQPKVCSFSIFYEQFMLYI